MTNTLGYYGNQAPGYDPSAGWITTDVRCRRCQAQLHGQHVGGRCPGCGAPAGLSIYGDMIHYSPPKWITTVRSGLLTVLWTSVAMVAVIILLAVGMVGMTMSNVQRGGGSGESEVVVFTIAIVIVVAIAILIISVGIWKMTAPDPTGAGEREYGAVRKFIRGATIAVIVVTLANVGIAMANNADELMADDTSSLSLSMEVATNLLQGILICAMAHYLGLLAMRVPDRTLAARGRLVLWGIAICQGLFVLMRVLLLAVGTKSIKVQPGASLMTLTCVNGLVALALLVFMVLFLVLLGQMAGRFRQAKAYADAVYAQPTAQPAPGTTILPPTA